MRWQEINENRQAYLYHATQLDSAARILFQDHLRALTDHRQLHKPSKMDDYGNVRGISLTRSLQFAKDWVSNDGAVFVLDQAKLRQRYQLRPYLYYRSVDSSLGGNMHQNKREAEEFLIGNQGIKPLSNYLVAVMMRKEVFRQCQEDNDDYGDNPEHSLYYSIVHCPLIKLY